MSTIASQPSRRAKVMQSPSTSRPSASALFISTVVPSSAVRMSPARMAVPLIMFSVAPTTASTLIGASRSASAAIVSITAAPPAMSNFMSTIARQRFDGQAAAVERHRLADEGKPTLAVPRTRRRSA